MSDPAARISWPGALLGRVLGGKIEVQSFLGGGGMGAVFRAHHRTLDKAVAVKVLAQRGEADALRSARFAREAQATARFDHPNAVRILDFGEDGPDGLLYLVMELLDGRDLDQILRRVGPLSPPKLAELMMPALAALAAAHEQGVIHRDLKPANIMVIRRPDDEGHLVDFVKVCDFGLAKVFGADVFGSEVTDVPSGRVVGTPLYMSPEQAVGEVVDGRSDVYSIGVVMYEMITGRPPFDAESKMEVMLKHVSEVPRPPSQLRPGLDPNFERLILWTLEKELGARCPSARELRRSLADYLRGGSHARILTGDLVLGVPAGMAPPSSQVSLSVLDQFDQVPVPIAEERWSSSASVIPLGDSNILGPAGSGIGDALTLDGPSLFRVGDSSAEILPDSAFLAPAPAEADMEALVAEAVSSLQLPAPGPTQVSADEGLRVDRRRHAEQLTDPAEYLWKHYGVVAEPFTGPHPFYVRDHRQELLGPLNFGELLKVLKKEGTAGHGSKIAVSPDGKLWLDGPTFVKLSGQETLNEVRQPAPPVHAGALQGSLDRTSLPALFARLGKEAPTGRLTFWSTHYDGERRVELHLVRGRPTFVYASDLAFELPQLLVDKRLITAEMLPRFMHLVLTEERPLEEVIGRYTGLDIVQYRPVFMKARLLHLFSWKKQGQYAFHKDALPGRLQPFAASLLQILPELVYLSTTPEELAPLLHPWLDAALERSERFLQGVAEMGLTPSQRTMAARFGRPRTLAASLEGEPGEKKMLATLAYLFLETGLLLRPL